MLNDVKRVKKVMLIGWDGAPPQIIERLINKGLLKNLNSLIKKGTFINALNPYPTITPQNWTTIATGAWPGRHGITSYNVHHPGEALDKIYSGFNTAECSVEYIWDAAERFGKKCILLRYETSWPPTIKKGIVIGGGGPNPQDEFVIITSDMIFTNDIYDYIPTAVCEKPDIVKINKSGEKYNSVLKFKTKMQEEKKYYIEWMDKTVTIFKDKEKKEILTTVKEGKWSNYATDKFLYNGKKTDATFRFKLIHLPNNENDSFKLLCTSILPTNDFSFPNKIGAELVKKFGPYLPRGGWESALSVGPETYLEYVDMYHSWLAKAGNYLLNKEEWDLFLTITHVPDYIHHLYMRGYDPITTRKESEHVYRAGFSQKQYESFTEQAYESADRMLGKILECADDETLVIVVSDHGSKTWLSDVNIREILVDKDLMAVNPDNGQVIWEKTKAVPQRDCYVYVNLKGRDPQGIVEPGNEYELVRNQIIEAFYDYVDQETKQRAFSLVLKREDARQIGLYGPRIGDIVYAFNTQFGHEHGQQLSTGTFGLGSLQSMIVLAGPGIKQGFMLEGMTGIQDIVPTLCYIADIPFPSGCQGAIIYDALEDPSFKIKKIIGLEKALENLKYAYEKQVSITHSRF